MATYRWIRTFCIQDNEGELNVGDVVEVEKASGEVEQKVVTATWLYTTKAGKKLTRAEVADS